MLLFEGLIFSNLSSGLTGIPRSPVRSLRVRSSICSWTGRIQVRKENKDGEKCGYHSNIRERVLCTSESKVSITTAVKTIGESVKKGDQINMVRLQQKAGVLSGATHTL